MTKIIVRGTATATLTAQNTFTAVLVLDAEDRVSVSVSGVSDSTVTLQRRLDEANWRDIDSWSGAIETTYVGDESQDLRLGIKTGEYGSDTVIARIGKG